MLAEEEDGLGEGDEDTPVGPDEGGDAGDVTAAGASCRGVVEWLIEFSAKAVAPPAPTMPPRISASTSGFIRRRRGGGWPIPEAMGGGVPGGYVPIGGVDAVYGQLPGTGVCGPEGPDPPAVVLVAPRPVGGGGVTGGAAGGAYAEAVPASAGFDPAGTGPDAGITGPDQAKPGRDGVPCANVRVSDSGSQFPAGCMAPTSASRPLAVGRCRGSLARQCSISGRTVGGTRSRLGAPCTTRYSSAAVVPVPNGPSPVAANASTAPRLKMSLGGPTS